MPDRSEKHPPSIAGAERTAAEALDEERHARYDAEHALAAVDALLASSLVGIGLLDTDFRYVRVNSVLAEINGHPPEDHLGRTLRDVMGDNADLLEPILHQVIATGEPVTNLEQRLPAAARTYVASYFPVRTQAGEVIGIGAAVADITRQKQIEQALHDAVHQRDKLLALVSHDLRNPLGAIQMAISLLAEIVPLDDPRTKRSLETIQRSVHRMDRLIDDLLDMSSIQAGRLAIVPGPVDAARLVTEALEASEPAARAKQITLERDAELDDVVLSCDRDRILQVLGNLLGNAIKFCAPGSHVLLRARADADAVRFEVSDTGPGIATTDLPHVFEPYWSAQPYVRQGTGLGLYITRGIIEAHGGQLHVDSTPGAGATFRFSVPRATPAA